MKLNSTNRETLKAIAIVILLLLVIGLFFENRKQKSMYQPGPVDIEAVSDQPFGSLKSSEECLKDSVYSTSTGGVCGGQKLVQDHANYKIVG